MGLFPKSSGGGGYPPRRKASLADRWFNIDLGNLRVVYEGESWFCQPDRQRITPFYTQPGSFQIYIY
jgi:hypothetical protein